MSKAVRGDAAVDNEAKELIAKINKFCAGDLGHRNMDNLSYSILKEFCYSLDVAKVNAEYSAKTKMEQKLGSVKGQLAVVKRKFTVQEKTLTWVMNRLEDLSSPQELPPHPRGSCKPSNGVRPFRV
jgi:hypothetical protein